MVYGCVWRNDNFRGKMLRWQLGFEKKDKHFSQT